MTQQPIIHLHTPPNNEPLTLDYVKSYMRITSNQDDILINSLIKTARHAAEKHLNASLINQLWCMCYSHIIPTNIKLSMGPVNSIISIESIQHNKTKTIISPNLYELSIDKSKLNFTTNIICHKMLIKYSTGYGPSGADIPAPIIQGMLAHILSMYDNRAGGTSIPALTLTLYAPYRTIRI